MRAPPLGLYSRLCAHSLPPSIVRLRVLPDEPGAVVGTRPRGSHGQTSRRPHTDAQVADVRRLIEQTALTYGEIAKRTGVGRASICRWTRDGGWQRPLFAPRATDTVPRPRAGQKLKLRLLAERLRTLAERYVRELEETPGVDLDRLVQALEVLKMARLRGDGPQPAAAQRPSSSTRCRRDARRRSPAGRSTSCATPASTSSARRNRRSMLLIDARTPPEEDHAALRAGEGGGDDLSASPAPARRASGSPR